MVNIKWKCKFRIEENALFCSFNMRLVLDQYPINSIYIGKTQSITNHRDR